MNIAELKLRIPEGYRIIEKIEEVDLYSACDILRSGRQRYITYAKRVGNSAKIITHRIKCPHCGREIPAYAHYCCKSSFALSRKSEVELSEWAEIQMSMMGEPEELLEIQAVYNCPEEYICEKCGHISTESQDFINLYLQCTDDVLCVKREIKNLAELVSFKWLTGVANISFPLYEQMVFDFKSGVACIELKSEKEVICTTRVTDSEIDFSEDVLVELLSKNRLVKRTVKRMFEKVSGEKLPFTVKELDFYKFLDFLRFKGFPKEFYEAIPFWKGTNVIDASFNTITEKLDNPQMAMDLLKKSDIPFCKSVKRVFAQNSGLFFYLNECEFLFSVFGDVNLFCTFLSENYILQFLSMMHYYEPSAKIFLTDFSRILGKTRFSQKISCSDRWINYGVHYASISSYVQKKEQERWLKGLDLLDDFGLLSYHGCDISIPMASAPAGFDECVVNKYRFKFLRTKKECIAAGEKMNNCLVNWDSRSNPVAIVYRGDTMVGAIEILDKTMVQAKERQNKSIEPGSELCNAIQKWCKKKKIEFDPDDMDGPFMPG